MSRTMKDSGIFDGVEIPTTWDTMKFGKVCSVVTDFVASGSFADLRENVPYLSEPDYAMLVRTTDLAKTARSEGKVYISKASYEFLSNSNLFGGEIVLPNIGSIGDVYVVPKLYERMSLAPNSIMFKTRYCDKYYYYYFLSKVGGLQLSEISQSTAMAKFNKTDLKQIRVFLPSLAEQQRIAEFLDRKCSEIDSLIELQEQMIEELKAYKQSVITEAVTKGLNPNVPMKDSGIECIGKIPTHWEVKLLRFVLDNLDYLREPISAEHRQRNNPIYDYYGASGVIDKIDYYNVDDTVLLIGEDGANLRMRNIPLIYKASGKFWVNNHAHILKPISDNYNYLAMLLEALDYSDFITGSAQPKLSQDNLKKVRLCIPPLAEQQAIADYLDKKCGEIDELITIKQQKIESLKEYKKSVIYEYVTGKREV